VAFSSIIDVCKISSDNLNLFNTSVSHIRFSEKMGWEMINVNSFSHLLKK
jgi:hypothetical protein